MELMSHAGGAGSYHAWIGFDKQQLRGAVVLSTANDLSVEALGWTLLQRLPLKQDSAKYFAREMMGFGFNLETQTNILRITKVFPESPASRAGLSAGMIIQKIEDVSTADKSVAECLSLLRANGPKVRLELIDGDHKTTNTVEITRGKFITAG
jgi:S1-C subfamily serine protease